MDNDKMMEILKKLEDYNIFLISFDNLGDVNIDNLKVHPDYLFDVLEDFE